MDTSAKNKILVLGRADVPKEWLVRSVIAASGPEETADTSLAAEDSSGRIEWQIDTRYYAARVEFWIDSTEQLPPEKVQFMERWLDTPVQYADTAADESTADAAVTIDSETSELQAQLGEVVDAVIFTFDPARADTFNDILPWAQFAQRFRPSVLLCVACGKHGGSEGDHLRDRLFAWCVAVGWEWVDLTDPDPASENTVVRVREALASNEWATMRTKDHGAQSSLPVSKEPRAGTPEAENGGVAEAGGCGAPEDPVARGEWERFEAVAGDLDPERIDNLHRTLFAELAAGSDSAAASSDVSALLSRLHSIRDEIAQLDTAQARARAAELALALAKKL